MPTVAKPYDLLDEVAAQPVRQRRVSTPIKALQVVPARHPWRWAGSIFAALVLLAIAHSLATNPRWEWGVFGQWFFSPSVLRGLGQTLLLTLLSTVFSILLGTALANRADLVDQVIGFGDNGHVLFLAGCGLRRRKSAGCSSTRR